MKYYLLDLENQPNLLKDSPKIAGLTWDSTLIVFYSYVVENRLEYIKENFSNVEYIKVGNGISNELDFNLVLHIGYLLGKFRGKSLNLVVLSKDRGFTSILDYVQSKEFPYELDIEFPLIDEIIVKTEEVSIINQDLVRTIDLPKNTNLNLSLLDSLFVPSLNNKRIEMLVLAYGTGYSESFKKVLCGSKDKNSFHNRLVATFGLPKATTMYNEMKSIKLYEL